MKKLIYNFCFCLFTLLSKQAVAWYTTDNNTLEAFCEKGYKYNIDNSYKNELNNIFSSIGIFKTDILLLECNGVNGIKFINYSDSTGQKRAIIFEPAYLDYINKKTNSNKWTFTTLLAHQVGLILFNNNFNDNNQNNVINADEFSGFVLAKLGATLEDVKITTKATHNIDADNDNWINYRLDAVERGWNIANYEIQRLSYKSKYQSAFSLKQYLPKIENCGSYSTIVGWATTYYARTLLDAKSKNITNPEEISKFAYAPIFTYLLSKTDDNKDCSGGSYINKALESLKTNGVPLYKDFYFKCTDSISKNIYNLAAKNKIAAYNKMFEKTDILSVKLDTIKSSLINGYPVIIGFDVYQSFSTAKEVYYKQNDNDDVYEGSITLCVVGYDDNKYGGAVEVVNCWGTEWGNDGFMWIPYYEFMLLTKYAYNIIPLKTTTKEKKKANKK